MGLLPNFELLTGDAGTGKTYTLKKRIQESRKLIREGKKIRPYGVLTATTGIAALNLCGVDGETITTINSALGYFDTASLEDKFAARKLHSALKAISKLGLNLCIDEASMLDAKQLDLIYAALVDINEQEEVQKKGGLGLVLSGDFAQLPPVKGEFCFNSSCWNQITINKLTKIWRQNNPEYIEMLNAARHGDGEKASQIACSMQEITLAPIIDSKFEGTTIVPVNKLVDSLNEIRLQDLLEQKNQKWVLKSFRWGRQLSEWKGIPEERIICKNAYVMILANDAPAFTYANGSCGYVVDCNIDTNVVNIKLVEGGVKNKEQMEEAKKSGREVKVRKVTRKNFVRDTPEGCTEPEFLNKKEWLELHNDGVWNNHPNSDLIGTLYNQYLQEISNGQKRRNPGRPYFDCLENKWVVGEVTYNPIKLAYASTVHKSQGLSLDRVQIDYSHAFFGEPSMSYVALSRAKTPEGLVIVGSKKLIELRTNISSEILDWV